MGALNGVLGIPSRKASSSAVLTRKRRYLGRYFAHPMMQNRRAKRDDYKPSAVRVNSVTCLESAHSTCALT
ncbi:hypothetical protein [Piscirickettsia salmonis]|uniref:hypothetical protein n=1 Tax=Piscirickettsia salmonis TaxID=1238 RepID=UPI0016627FFB|nr:hypothetical protein [Piscirickettsia salmonis]QNR82562.1 hypothetical protein ICC15_19125 [Piscirickettsia salmonis]